jgi:hypothetical protein
MPKPFKKEKENHILKKIWHSHYWSRMSRDSNFMPRYQAAMRYYYDQTLTDEDVQILRNRGQSDVSINWLRILLKQMQSFMTANRPQWGAFGIGHNDTRSAKLSDAVLATSWRSSYGYLQISDIIKKAVVGGVGLLSSYIDYRADNGAGEIKFMSLPIQFFYGDWRTMNPMYDDMSFQQVSYTIDIATAIGMSPDRKNDILKLSTVRHNYDTLFQEGNIVFGQHPDPYELDRVRYLTHYQIESDLIWEITDLTEDESRGNKYYLNDEPNFPLPYAMDIKRVDRPRLVKYDCFYGSGEDDGIIFNTTRFPFDKFMIKPFIDEFMENAYGVGEAYFLEKLNNYLNKSLRIALQHEMWNSNPGVFIPKGSIQDKKGFEERVLWPGFVEEYEAEFGNPFFKSGVAGQTGFYNTMNIALDAMRNMTGNMFRPEMAKGNATEDQLLKSMGQEHGDDLFRSFETALEESAKTQLMLAKHHYDFPKMLRYIDKRKRPASMLVNRGFVDENGEMQQFYISEMDIDVAVATKSYAPTQKMVNVRMLTEAMNRAPQNVQDILFLELMKAMEIDPEITDEIEARFEMLPKLLQQMEQMGQALEQMQKENKQLESQVFTADRKAIRADYGAELDSMVSNFKANMRAIQKIYQDKLNNNLQQVKQSENQNGKTRTTE